MKSFKVELLDEYIFLQNKANDHQIRFVVELNGHIDTGRLKKAVEQSIIIVPLLACRLVVQGPGYIWQEIPTVKLEDYIEVYEKDEINNDRLVEVLGKRPDHFRGPQLLISVLRSAVRDVLLITINHMALDGSGFKQYLVLLSSLYNGGPVTAYNENRDLFSVIDGPRHEIKIIKSRARGCAGFLTDAGLDRKAKLFVHRIENADFRKIRNFCKSKNASVNDIMMTLFVMSLLDAGYLRLNKKFSISMMIDARRYDTDGLLSPFVNAASMEKVFFSLPKEETESALAIMHEELAGIKDNSPGLANLLKLKRLKSLLPAKLYRRVLAWIIQKPNVSATNLGVLKGGDIGFKDLETESAYFVTSLKKNNSLQFTFSAYNDELTITSFGLYSNAQVEAIAFIYKCLKDRINRLVN